MNELKSVCCNSTIIPSKGSYAGETTLVCYQCGKRIASALAEAWEFKMVTKTKK